MPSFSNSIDIAAPVERIWAVMSDVARWSEWTPSITSVKRLEEGPLAPGSRALVHQPKLRPTVWTVTDMEPGRSFTWESRVPGMRTIGRHAIEAAPGGGRVTLTIEFHGLLARGVAWFSGDLVTRYMQLEAEGLKRRSEDPAFFVNRR